MTDAVSVMSGAEADVSSDGDDSSCFEDDLPLPPSPLKEGTDEPFTVVLKGGSPWGFTLKTGSESKSSILVGEVESEGKAHHSGNLRCGDYILEVNEVRCNSVTEAEQLIDSAFRTLTLRVWRGAGDPVTAPVRSASFLQKKAEISERARQQASVQDDSVLFRESKSATATRMKPRQRRIESFHAGRRGSSQASSSPGVSASALTPRQNAESSPFTPPTSTTQTSPAVAAAESESAAKPGLKGWATEHDLSSRQKPVIMSGSHMTRTVPLSAAKSSPSLNQDDAVNASSTPRGYTPKAPPTLNMTKSTTDIPEHLNYENITSPTSPKSPTWYQTGSKLPNKTMFDFSSSSSQRRSPRNSYAGGSPRNSYSSGSPRNSYAGYSSSYTAQGFSPMSVPSSGSYRHSDSNRSGANSSYNQKLTGANTNSYDDTPTSHSTNKHYDRRSLPPHQLQQFRQEFHRDNAKAETQRPLTSMPVTREEDDINKEIPDMKPGPPNDVDRRPMYSPPAPPVRDISSLKYVKATQNHEKYPSWPVTTAQAPQNLGPPIDAQQKDKVKERKETESSSDSSGEKNLYVKEKVRNSPVERRGSEEKQIRNQSDPGFKQKPKKSFYTTRRPQEPDYANVKQEGERFDEFCKTSKPGYPPPKLDPDGHNFGDEKYNIPSPPERDIPNFDEKSLVEKIAAVISPNSQYQPSYHHSFQYNMAAENNPPRSSRAEAATSPMPSKLSGTYFQQAVNAQNLLRSNNPSNKNMVDSGTSPIHSPTSDDRNKGFRLVSPSPRRSESNLSPEKRGLIIKQMPFYNTSTQTDESLSKSEQMDSGAQSNQPTSLTSMSSATSYVRSDNSSQSSGIGSMNFSDQSNAGMLRKLSEEFYSGKLSGKYPEKRMSSSSNYDELKSPRSESHYQPGLREAESYSSVVIHAHEPHGLFGRDDLGSSPSLAGSKLETSDNEHSSEYSDFRQNRQNRHSMDSGMLLQKAVGSTSMAMPPRGLQESRFTSESNLSSGNHSQRNQHSQSLMHLNRPSGSQSEDRQSQKSSNSSSTSSRPRGSMEARSSGSRIGSDSSTGGSKVDRPTSDSVFYDSKSTGTSAETNNDDKPVGGGRHSVGIGRKESMKLAFGTYDEHEHHYATPYAHQRNSSEVLSPTSRDPGAMHGRSMSFNDYMPMSVNQSDPKLGLIKEEGSEQRWQEAVQKSKSLSREHGGANYENVTLNSNDQNMSMPLRNSDSDKSDLDKKVESKTRSGMRRTASEQIRPKKERSQFQKHSDSGSSKGGYSSSGGESSKGNKSDGENVPHGFKNRQQDLKKLQFKSVLDYVERTKKGSSDGSDSNSPQHKETAPEFPPPPIPDNKSLSINPHQHPQSPLGDITKRYKYTQQQRGESLRRTQSITSNSSRDSDYVDMKRLEQERNYQTEWKRLRGSMDGTHPRRPLSIGSDIMSSLEGTSTPTSMLTSDNEGGHRRHSSETVPKHIEAEQARQEPSESNPIDEDGNMVTAPIYHNLNAGDYPRRPPPPVPGVNPEDKPPALPPRRFASSKSESFLLSRVDANQRDNLRDSYSAGNRGDAGAGSESSMGGASNAAGSGKNWDGTGTLKQDAYAQQLRKQARRFSEQHKPPVGISMQVVSTKTTVNVSLSQSYKQEPTQVLEAVPVQRHSPQTSQVHTDAKQTAMLHSPTLARDRVTPEPPPMPTPLKNGETEISTDLNKTADFPPPPVEFMETSDEHIDRCADDSYGSYKSRDSREVGKYKRTTSDTSLLRSHQDQKLYRPVPQLDTSLVTENTPNKPPRKKLELGNDSPSSAHRSNSPNMVGNDSHLSSSRLGTGSAPQVPLFQPAEASTVQHANKYVAKPLQGLNVQKLNSPSSMSSSGGSFVGTVVQRPAMGQNQNDRRSSDEDEGPKRSVKDRVKSIEVFSHSPGQTTGQSNGPSKGISGEDKNSAHPDSLEQLEFSMSQNDNPMDRLRPVVKSERSDEGTVRVASPVNAHRISTDVADSTKGTPPIVPNRTYKQHSQTSATGPTPYRKESFQNRGPKPYENKANSGANIHNPLAQNNFMNNYKSGSGPEPKRSPGQSMPEPQVPSRTHKPAWSSPSNDHHSRDQNPNVSSHNARMNNYKDESVQNKENTQGHSVHSGQKRNYEKSFSRTRNSSGGSSNNSVNSDSQSVATNFHSYNSPPNTHGDNKSGAGHSKRPESRGETYSNKSHDQRSPPQGQVQYNHSFNARRSRDPRSSQPSELPLTPTSSSQSFSSFNQSPANFSRNQPVETNQESTRPVSLSRSQSQTDEKPETPVTQEASSSVTSTTSTPTVNHGRQPSAEELECDQKAQELAQVLKDKDKQLCEVLTTDSKKSRMQFMDGIMPASSDHTEQRRPRSGTKPDKQQDEKEKEKEDEPTSPMPSNYYVSPPKAMIELEIRKLTDSNQLDTGDLDNEALHQKKEELLERMVKKLDVLKECKEELLSDIEDNESLGSQIMTYVQAKCSSSQEKYRCYIEDIDKIIKLLLKLSGLLARAENTIQGLTENTNEKVRKMTYEKRDRLYRQHEDAKELKMDIDRRSAQLEEVLKEKLSEMELADYHHYIRMKSKYTIQMQELEDKITLGNEQISALEKSMPLKK